MFIFSFSCFSAQVNSLHLSHVNRHGYSKLNRTFNVFVVSIEK